MRAALQHLLVLPYISPPSPLHLPYISPGNGQCELRCNISSCAFDRGDCGVGLAMSAVLGGGFVKKEVATSNELTLMGVGIGVGVLVGLFILRAVLKKKQAQEIKLRGYTLEERAGMDGTSDDI